MKVYLGRFQCSPPIFIRSVFIKGYIYLIENKINNKKYIGKTYNSIANRWAEHIRASRYEANKHRLLYKAINKYGLDNFTVSEVEYCENCEEREKYWIQFYDSYKNGYNATLGGDGKPFLEFTDEEVLEKYNELKSITQVAEYFNCSQRSIAIRLTNHGIDVMSNGGNIYNEKRNWTTTKVNQLSKKNEYIQSFDTLTKAAEWLIENNHTTGQIKHIVCNIGRVIKGERKTAYNFCWNQQEV